MIWKSLKFPIEKKNIKIFPLRGKEGGGGDLEGSSLMLKSLHNSEIIYRTICTNIFLNFKYINNIMTEIIFYVLKFWKKKRFFSQII